MIPDLIPRTDWEEPGWTVDQHTSAGPHPYTRTQAVIVHYTGAVATPESKVTVRDFIRRTQRDYVNNRGYSIGYNWAVDRNGNVWELRGDDYKCAANGNSTTNDDPAVLCLVNADDDANELMVEAIRDVVAHCEDMTGRTLAIKGHRDVRATTCPGDGLYAQVQAGTFRPAPPAPPPEEDDAMSRVNAVVIRMKGTADHWLCFPIGGDTKSRLAPDEPTPIVVDGDRAEFARRAGYPLTPMPGE